MEIRVVESDVSLEQSHKYDSRPIGSQIKGGKHRPFVSRRIDDEVGELASEAILQLSLEVDFRVYRNGVIDPKRFAAKAEPGVADIGDGDVFGSIAKEGQNAEPNGAGSKNEGAVGRRSEASVHGVLTDAEHFHEGELIH